MQAGQISSIRHDWETPQPLFDALNEEFRFTLDAAASDENTLCPNYFTEHDDALQKNWTGTVFCNPPYGHGVGKWVIKAFEESCKGAEIVVVLIPSRTETAWWHDYAMKAREIRLVRGRVAFGRNDPTQGTGHNAPFPSAVLVFRGEYVDPVRFSTMSRFRAA